MGIVKNDFVEMPWQEENWLKAGSKGFLASVQEYSTDKYDSLYVCFHEGKAFMFVDDDLNVLDGQECFEHVKEARKAGDTVFDMYMDDVVTIVEWDGYSVDCEDVDLDTLSEIYGITDDIIADVTARLKDVSAYWQTIEQSM